MYESVKMYSIFWFEPMHNRSLRLSKFLEDRLRRYLLNPEKISSSLAYNSSNPKPYAVIRKNVLDQRSQLLRKTERQHLNRGWRAGFSNGKCGGKLCGLLTESGIHRTLEAPDYDKLDLVSLYFWETVDALCGIFRMVPYTALFCSYVDLVLNTGRTFSVSDGLKMSSNCWRIIWIIFETCLQQHLAVIKLQTLAQRSGMSIKSCRLNKTNG